VPVFQVFAIRMMFPIRIKEQLRTFWLGHACGHIGPTSG
jgi:hypothetical protein